MRYTTGVGGRSNAFVGVGRMSAGKLAEEEQLRLSKQFKRGDKVKVGGCVQVKTVVNVKYGRVYVVGSDRVIRDYHPQHVKLFFRPLR